MADGLLECVPNVSEGRDRAVILRLGDAVERAGVRLLDVHADADHHRSVFTFMGPPEMVEKAALALGCAAVELIDIRRHAGVHPRLGALDVMPFVPLAGLPMRAAVAAAHRVGRELAAATGVPVFFYGEAACVPARRELPAIRAGGLESLPGRLATPAGRPDAGPAVAHPTAGAAVVGARWPLIAFNAVLDTADVEIARAVAKAIREVSGGLPAVRALGVPLASRARAQVSMNLLDYRRTPPARVVERVDEECARRSTRVVEYELVGCAPAGAFPPELRQRIAGLKTSQLLAPELFGEASVC